LERPMLLTAIVIGHTSSSRRLSHWTKAFTHPKNGTIRFERREYLGKGFSGTWGTVFRERSGIKTHDWLNAMNKDSAFDSLVHNLRIPVPVRREEFVDDIYRMRDEISRLPEVPPMRRSGCHGFSPCIFRDVCFAPERVTPKEVGHIMRSEVTNLVHIG
jgi:hypothetical protein